VKLFERVRYLINITANNTNTNTTITTTTTTSATNNTALKID